jgi:lipopolysaccharide export system permease protein
MRTYIRYLLLQLLLPTLLITLAFSGAVWLSQSLRFVDLIVNKGLPLTTFLYLSFLLFPSLLLVILPFAVFCGILYAYNRLTMESELTVFRSAGLSNLQLAGPGMMIAVVTTVIGYGISLWMMPWAFSSFRDLQYEIRGDFSHVLLQEGVFGSPVDGVTVYVRERGPDGALAGILVHDGRDPLRPVTMMAERGFLMPGERGPRFVLLEGSRQELDPRDGLGTLYFTSYTVDLAVAAQEPDTRWRRPKERYLADLLFPDDSAEDRRNYNQLVAEGHRRLTWPLAAVVFALLGMAAILPRHASRGGHGRALLGAVVAALLVQALTFAVLHFAARTLAVIPLLYLLQAVPIAVALALIAGWQPRRASRPAAGGMAPAQG